MRFLTVGFVLLSAISTAVMAEAVTVTDFNTMEYEKARSSILAAGWEPVSPKAEPEDHRMVRKFKGLGFSELEWCSVDTCVFRFERGNELLGVVVYINKYDADRDAVQNSYLKMKDGSDPVGVGAQSQSVVSSQLNTAPEMSQSECLKVQANLFYYLSSAGIKDYDAKFKPLMNLIKNGNFTFQGASVKGGECYQTILVDGVYLGSSYKQELTGIARAF